MCAIGATDLTDVGRHQGTKVETQLLASVHFDDGVRLAIEVGKRTCNRLAMPIFHRSSIPLKAFVPLSSPTS